MGSNDKPKRIRKKREKIPLTAAQKEQAQQQLAKRKKKNPDVYNLPTSKRTISDLSEYFTKVEEDTRNILPKEKRRYVIYLRKSTDDEERQVRSLDDQLAECLKLAHDQGITVREEDIFSEAASAKVSGNRPVFDEMLRGFMTKKYHGLIAWSPDRISRNMKEAGEVIEMLDHEYIQDLQFKTYQFENNPNGKMLLGILFATSKQYSDKLSVDVKRGNTGNIQDGLYTGVTKKGYYVDSGTGYFVPDGYNWELLREAVSMRLYQGKTNVEVAKFLNDAHFGVRKDQDEELHLVKFTKQMVGNMFEDPFYFGLYKYGPNIANLTDLYDFLPLITPDEYIVLNQGISVSFGSKGKVSRSQRLDYGLLRDRVVCDFCDEIMKFQHTEIKRGKNAGKFVISFYCRNKECLRHNEAEAKKQFGKKLSKSIRANIVMAHIEWTLRHCTKKSKAAYRMYIDKLELRLAQDRAIAKRKLAEAKNDLRTNQQQYFRYQDFQVKHPAEYNKHHKGKLEHYQKLVNMAEHNIATNEKELKRLEADLPTEQEFYELINSYLLTLLNTKDLVEQNAVCEELVSNLRAGDDIIPVIKLNPPYDMLVDLGKISTGRG